MTRTNPDYGIGQGAGTGLTTVPDINLTEVPSRLMSPDLLRRTGRVYLIDKFENLNQWWTKLGATIDPTVGYMGDSSVKFSTIGNYIYRGLPYFPYTNMGIELMGTFSTKDVNRDCELYIQLGIFDNVSFNVNSIRIKQSTQQIINQGVGVVGNHTIRKIPGEWFNVKFIMRFSDSYITRVMVNEVDITTSIPPTYSGPVSDGKSLGLNIGYFNSGTGTDSFNITNLILTTEEP